MREGTGSALVLVWRSGQAVGGRRVLRAGQTKPEHSPRTQACGYGSTDSQRSNVARSAREQRSDVRLAALSGAAESKLGLLGRVSRESKRSSFEARSRRSRGRRLTAAIAHAAFPSVKTFTRTMQQRAGSSARSRPLLRLAAGLARFALAGLGDALLRTQLLLLPGRPSERVRAARAHLGSTMR